MLRPRHQPLTDLDFSPWWEYLQLPLGSKITIKFSIKTPHLIFRVYRLLSDRFLCCNEAILASYPFLDFLLLIERQGCTFHFVTPDPRSKKSKLKMTIQTGNIESKLRLSAGFMERIESVVNWNETTVYMLGFCVGFVAALSFWAWIFSFSDRALRNGVCSLFLLLGVVNLEMDNSLKWPRCNKVSGQTTCNPLWK